VELLYESIANIALLEDSLASLEEESQEAGFEVRATGYGLDALLPLVSRTYSLRLAGRSEYYAEFVRAQRIAGYVDSYLSRLLSILMRDGELGFKKMTSANQAARDAILIGMIFAGLFLFGYVYVVANSITRPIRILAKASEKLARGELEVQPIELRSRDEVSVLADRFYAMSANIRAYIEGLKEKADLEAKLHQEERSLLAMEKALREAQLMNLQDQMRPHFLFNALNSIARTALLEGAQTTEGLTISLARLLRSTMKKGGFLIPLAEEIDIAKEYLSFQKVRFGARLEWKVACDPLLSQLKVPRFLLQPLVENAVRHGVEPKEEGTRVLVDIRKHRDELRIRVMDSGAGMDISTLGSLREQIKESIPQNEKAGQTEPKGIGVVNLARRIFMLYGSSARLTLYSRKGRGTLVVLVLPAGGTVQWPGS
jgi:sensor histidine kinase YesM